MTVYIKTLISVTNHTKNPEAHHKSTENNSSTAGCWHHSNNKFVLPSQRKVLHLAVKTLDAGFLLGPDLFTPPSFVCHKHSVLASQISKCGNTKTHKKTDPSYKFPA